MLMMVHVAVVGFVPVFIALVVVPDRNVLRRYSLLARFGIGSSSRRSIAPEDQPAFTRLWWWWRLWALLVVSGFVIVQAVDVHIGHRISVGMLD
jgi:hypothetical protein